MWESDEAIEEDMSESPDTEKHDKEKEQRNSKKARGVCVLTSIKIHNSQLKGEIIHFLIRFIYCLSISFSI